MVAFPDALLGTFSYLATMRSARSYSLETQFSEQIQQALRMEREQITDAYSTYAFDEHGMRIHASQYYNETYGNKDDNHSSNC
jgi:hypothetical protein